MVHSDLEYIAYMIGCKATISTDTIKLMKFIHSITLQSTLPPTKKAYRYHIKTRKHSSNVFHFNADSIERVPSISELHNKAFPASTTPVPSQVEIYPIPTEERVSAPACL